MCSRPLKAPGVGSVGAKDAVIRLRLDGGERAAREGNGGMGWGMGERWEG